MFLLSSRPVEMCKIRSHGFYLCVPTCHVKLCSITQKNENALATRLPMVHKVPSYLSCNRSQGPFSKCRQTDELDCFCYLDWRHRGNNYDQNILPYLIVTYFHESWVLQGWTVVSRDCLLLNRWHNLLERTVRLLLWDCSLLLLHVPNVKSPKWRLVETYIL